MIKAFRCLASRTSLKLYFVHSHFAFFHNLGAVNDEHGKRFYQGIAVVEKRCKGKSNPSMLGNYCCRNSVKQNIIAMQSVYYFVSGCELFTCVILFFQFNDSSLTELIGKNHVYFTTHVVVSQTPDLIEKN